ncbi:MAG: NmrA family NAD(P)-binding protein [Sphingobacteriia bacterium]|jgi:nucleoside-diphosphate-sugar epimerase
MNSIIIVAGATGNLGGKIVTHLIHLGAKVVIITRKNSDQQKVEKLIKLGATVKQIEVWDVESIASICEGATCVISALSGLKEVIIDAQTILLDAAVKAGVPRFIPSDYSLDFTPFNDGENRNLDWRRSFHQILEKRNIAATTIFNGAFADMLTGQMPLILFKQKLVLHWGNSDHPMCFTSIDNTAEYTAHVALDNSTPRFLHIAGDIKSPRELQAIISMIEGKKYKIFKAGGLVFLSTMIKIVRFMSGGENELYPPWQGMQYMRNMIDDRAKLSKIDNNRYPSIKWTSAEDILKSI